jgi:hypothetical protein
MTAAPAVPAATLKASARQVDFVIFIFSLFIP